MIRPRFGLLALFLLLLPPAGAFAQATRCRLIETPTTRLSFDSTAIGRITFIGGGVLIECPGRNIKLRGDSAEQYPDHDQLIGHATYDEPRFHVTADYLNYFPSDERVVAAGNVNAKLPSGSTLVGPQAEYRRAVPRIRPRQQMTAFARPTITIVEKDSAGRPTPPTTVIANTVFMDGDSLIYAGGQVVITRPDVNATADSTFIDEGRETMRLMRNPKLTSKKDRPFTLTGDLIDLFSRNRKLQRVLSSANATAVSDSMTLKSDTIDLRLTDGLLNHAFAWGKKTRAQAISPSQTLFADSLDVSMPGQRVQLVRAIRRALAQGKADTVRFRAVAPDTMDWLEGDTIVAKFDTMPAKSRSPKDTSNTPNIRELVASGHASSLYHLAPSDSAERRPAINHVTARLITISFNQENQQRVATVTTVDSVTGIYIEPRSDSTSRRAAAAGAPGTPVPPGKTPPKSVIPLPPKKP